ncbi:hypothetical protein [Pseudonocardia sp. GCM10023141]
MTELIAQVLSTSAWIAGVLVLVVMAALPLMELFAQGRRHPEAGR